MSGIAPDLRSLLMPAVEAARAALADLESEEVPAALRRVVAHSGGKLPPPLVKSVLTALDGSEWLRGKAAEKLPDHLAESPSGAFLDRGDGWWLALAEGLADARAGAAGEASARSAAEVDELTAQLGVAKKRLKQVGADLDAERVRARRRAGERREAPPRRSGGGRDAAAKIRDLETRLAATVDDRVEAEAMIARLRSRLKTAVREQRRAAAGSAPPSALDRDPISSAKELDLRAAAAPHRWTSDPEGSPAADGAQAATLRLPLGIRPDTAAAVEWLGAIGEPLTVIVDGYNVLYGLDPATFTTTRSRGLLADQLARLRRALAAGRVVVVYDSNLPGDREPRTLAGGVELHFSQDDELADDRIVELVAHAPAPVVVVTSDRDLRERAEAVGALALWSEALVGWMSPG